MAEEQDNKGGGLEVIDSAVSTSSTAATQPTDKNQVNVTPQDGIPPTHEAKEEEGGDVPVSAAAAAAQGEEGKVQEDDGPFDEENVGGSATVPIRHVDPTKNQGGGHHADADDVSSLQHSHHTNNTTEEGNNKQQYQPREEAIVEEGDMEYYQEETERQKALQRRNMLIIIMLLLFLGLVVAIGVGVGLAVKGAPPSSNPNDNNNKEDNDTTNVLTDDDEYDGLGGGLDTDDALQTSNPPSSYPSNEGPCIPIELGIIFDEYSSETGWFLVKGPNYDPQIQNDNNIVWKSKYYNDLEYNGRADTFHKCFTPGVYTFVFTDKEGDGICCYHGEGSYVLSSEGKVITIGGPMDSEEESSVFELPFDEPEPVDDNGDGMDDRLGWVMPYDSSTMLIEGDDCENFRLVIVTDQYGIETTWELFEGVDRSGNMIANGGPYGSEYTYVIDYCLASKRKYVLYMYDWDRRGLCCHSGEGSYRVTSGDIVINVSDGQFGEVDITQFVLPADGSVVFTDRPPLGPTGSSGILNVGGKKTAYPTASLMGLVTAPSPPPVVVVTPSPTKRPTRLPTSSLSDKEITPFPTPTPPEEIRDEPVV